MMPQDAGHPDHSSPLPHQPRRDAGPIAGRIEPSQPRPAIAPTPPPGLQAAPDILSLLSALRRRWISAVLLGGTLAAIAAVACWYLLAPRQTGFAKLHVAFNDPSFFSNPHNVHDFKTLLQTTAGKIMSRNVITAALKRDEVRRLNLDGRFPDPILAIEEDMAVEFKENSELLTIKFTNEDPQVATVVANAITEAYMDDFVYRDKNLRVRNVTELEKAYNESVDAIKTKKENLKKTLENLGTSDPTLWRETRMEMATELRDAKQRMIQIGLERVKAQANLEAFDIRVKALNTKTTDMVASAKIDREAEINKALNADQEYRQLKTRLDGVEGLIQSYYDKGYGENYVSVKTARERAKTVRGLIAKRRKEVIATIPSEDSSPAKVLVREDPKVIRTALASQVSRLEDLEKNLKQQIEKLAADKVAMPKNAQDHDQLADEIKQAEKAIADLSTKLERQKVELRAAPRVSRYQDAELMKVDRKKQLLATIAAPLAVLAAVCMGLAWLEFQQRRVRAASEVSRGLGIRVVGAVPNTSNLDRQLVGPTGESELEGTPVMESIDAIRTRLLHEANTRATRIVMVTSATGGEGKTTLAAALASSLARAGRKTLLLDGDLRRPTLHELFEIPQQPGFSEILLGEIEIQDAVQESTQENLGLVPAGQWDREVLLALAREGLEGIFDKMQQEFDFIIIDSHPVLSATDALLIGRQADAVILSVLRDVSQLPKVYAAQQQLTTVGIRVLGAVVNAADPEEVFANTPGVAMNQVV